MIPNQILTMKLLLTHFWKRLPKGDLISLTPISLAFSKSSQIGPSSSKHLKTVPQLIARCQRFHRCDLTQKEAQKIQDVAGETAREIETWRENRRAKYVINISNQYGSILGSEDPLISTHVRVVERYVTLQITACQSWLVLGTAFCGTPHPAI